MKINFKKNIMKEFRSLEGLSPLFRNISEFPNTSPLPLTRSKTDEVKQSNFEENLTFMNNLSNAFEPRNQNERQEQLNFVLINFLSFFTKQYQFAFCNIKINFMHF